MNNRSNSSPIFIGGIYKSGTSLLRAMLSSHSNIAGGLETFWFNLDYEGWSAQNIDTRNWDATRNEPLKEHVIRLAKFFDLDFDYVIDLSEQCTNGEEFIDYFMAEYAAKQGKKIWVEKTPANLLHLERIHLYWPMGFFIHVVRDPRDVYSSVRRSGKWKNPQDFVNLWTKFIGAYEQAKNNVPNSFIMEVQYENLVLNPSQTMHDVLKFVGQPWEEKTADYRGDSTDYEKVKELTGITSSTLKQLSNPLLTKRICAWKYELDNLDDLEDVEEMIKDNQFAEIWNKYKFNL